eukprot:376854_1
MNIFMLLLWPMLTAEITVMTADVSNDIYEGLTLTTKCLEDNGDYFDDDRLKSAISGYTRYSVEHYVVPGIQKLIHKYFPSVLLQLHISDSAVLDALPLSIMHSYLASCKFDVLFYPSGSSGRKSHVFDFKWIRTDNSTHERKDP